MKTLLVLLDLQPLSSIALTNQIIPYLQGTGTWARLTDKMWLIKTSQITTRVRDDIRTLLGSLSTTADKVIVIDVSKSDWASYNFSPEVTNWIRDNI